MSESEPSAPQSEQMPTCTDVEGHAGWLNCPTHNREIMGLLKAHAEVRESSQRETPTRGEAPADVFRSRALAAFDRAREKWKAQTGDEPIGFRFIEELVACGEEAARAVLDARLRDPQLSCPGKDSQLDD
jgi:hypothetical protein